jgi:hypothetical protein
MAFTAAEEVRIRRYLGWSDRFNSTDEALARALSAVGARPDTETEIRLLISYCDTIEADIIGSKRRLKALQVGTIELPGPLEIGQLRDLGRQWTAQIASLLGVETRNEAWSGSGQPNRAWYDGPIPGGGGLISFG